MTSHQVVSNKLANLVIYKYCIFIHEYIHVHNPPTHTHGHPHIHLHTWASVLSVYWLESIMRCMAAVRPDGEPHQAVLLDGFTVACGGDQVRPQDMLSSVALFLRQIDHDMGSHFHTVYQCCVLIMGEQEGRDQITCPLHSGHCAFPWHTQQATQISLQTTSAPPMTLGYFNNAVDSFLQHPVLGWLCAWGLGFSRDLTWDMFLSLGDPESEKG